MLLPRAVASNVFGAVFAPWVAPHNPFDLTTLVLSDAQALRCMVLRLTGTHPGGAYEVHCPTNRKIYVVWNSIGNVRTLGDGIQAAPLFVRIVPEIAHTSTFKSQKGDLRKEGYGGSSGEGDEDDVKVEDPIYVLSGRDEGYVEFYDEYPGEKPNWVVVSLDVTLHLDTVREV